jgi:hypothetical protein
MLRLNRPWCFWKGGVTVATARPSVRLHVEALEERTMLNNRSVVPVGVPVDNTTNFASLQSALATAGLNAGDVIQIEPNSAPGNVTATGPAVANLTIQGDPASPVAAIPQFTFSNTFTVAAGQSGFVLKNVNVGLVAGANSSGSLALNASATITASMVVDVSAANVFPLILAGASDVLTNCTLVNNATVGNGLVEIATPAGGSSNLISDNTFVAAATANILVAYAGGSSATVTDTVVSNNFVADAGITVGSLLAVQESIAGLTIQNNTFSGPAGTGIFQSSSTPTNLKILGNTLNLQPPTAGIELMGGAAGTTVSGVIADNVITTAGAGTGLYIRAGTAATAAVNLKIEANDFHDNQFGVFIVGGSGPIAGVDLGGGNQGSPGDNNFRGFIASGSPTAGAIFLSAVTMSEGTIAAEHNLFAAGVTPANVVWDPNSNLDLANPLSATAAFVAALYNDFLQRPGDTTSALDAGYWVNRLSAGTLTPTAVVNAITQSSEALGVIVNQLYQKILGRTADAAGLANFVSMLQHGATVEQVVTDLVTSQEYANLSGFNSGYVQSLYVKLLGRIGSNAEVASWAALVPTQGRAAVASAILASAEFRGDVIEQLYGTPLAPAVSVPSTLMPMLHRLAAPSPAEVAGWVNSGLNALTLVADFAQAGEFFSNG